MRRLHAVPVAEVRVPLQVHAELLVGAAKSKNPAKATSRVLTFLAPFLVAWPDAAVEDHYVAIRTHLEALGTPISEADLWILRPLAPPAARWSPIIRVNSPVFPI